MWAFPWPEYNWLVFIVLFILDCLLSQPVDPNSKEMPSPAALKHKIILKVNHSQHAFFLAHHKDKATLLFYYPSAFTATSADVSQKCQLWIDCKQACLFPRIILSQFVNSMYKKKLCLFWMMWSLCWSPVAHHENS